MNDPPLSFLRQHMIGTPPQHTPGEAFEVWWEAHGRYGRAGGGDYEKTFAFNAWMAAQGHNAAVEGSNEASTAHDACAIEQRLNAAVSEADFEAIPLKHCPFCGPGNSIPGLWFDDSAHRWRVGCGSCGCSTGMDPRDKTPRPAILSWNKRA